MKPLFALLLVVILTAPAIGAPQRLLSNAPLTANMSTNVSFETGDSATISVTVAASNNTASTDQTIVTVNASNDGQTWANIGTITLTNAGTLDVSTIGSVTVGAADVVQLCISNTTSSASLTNFCTVITNKKAKL
jgi:hypothetical protein